VQYYFNQFCSLEFCIFLKEYPRKRKQDQPLIDALIKITNKMRPCSRIYYSSVS